MLILRRKSGESIVISDNIVLTVLDINEGSVRLAIDAPKEIPILRSELLQAADANRASAATETSPSRDLLRLLDGNRSGRPHPIKPHATGRAPAASAPTASAEPSPTASGEKPDAPRASAEPAPTASAEPSPAASGESPDAPTPEP